MKKLAIFDLDGTLIDTLMDLAIACNYALEKNHLPTYDVESYKFFVGNGVYKLIDNIIPKENHSPEMVDAVKKLFDEHYAEHFKDFVAPYDGIMELLTELKNKNIKLAVFSNKPHKFTQELVESLFPNTFELAFGQREGIPHKPDPTALFEILELLKATPQDCVYIGDSGVDMQTAGSANIFSIGVLWGFRPKEELEEYGAKVLIHNPKEILNYIVN